MRILVTGSTTWNDRAYLCSVLKRFSQETVFVTGDTDGVDALVIEIGTQLGYRVDAMSKTLRDSERHPGEAWKGLNERMIAAGISLVLAFHPDLDKPGFARGTQHVIELANAFGIPIEYLLRDRPENLKK